MLTQLADELWTTTHELKMGLLYFPTRCVIVRLPQNKLWVHSPTPLSEKLAAEVDRLGEVAYVVAPNTFHHLHLAQWHERYPQSERLVTPALKKKRADLGAATDLQPGQLAESIDVIELQGNQVAEHVFFHRPSRTLIVTDLVFNVRQHDRWLTRMMFRLVGTYGRAKTSRSWSHLVKAKQPFTESLQRVLACQPRVLIPAHGEPVMEEATEVLRTATQKWL